MVDTYSSHPFISHDGPDKSGIRAEIKVVTGLGEVVSISSSDKGKSANVSFLVGNTKFKPAGWAPKDSNVIKLVEEAKANNEAIEFRIETRRKDNVDRSLPIGPLCDTADKAKENIYKSLAAVKRVDDTEWTISPYALTNMAEDPSTGGGNSANDYTAEQLEAMKPNATPKSGGNGGNGGGFNNCGGREGAPYMLKNKDGQINPGGMAVAAPLNIMSFVSEYIRDNGYGEDVTPAGRWATVNMLLRVCNGAQNAMYGGELERPDMAAGSHTRARALVFDAIKSQAIVQPDNLLTAEVMNDADALAKWAKDTLKMVVKIWNWSIDKTNELMF